MSEETKRVTIVTILETKSGFGVTDDGVGVFIPRRVTEHSGARMGDVMFARVAPNNYDKDGDTPLMARYMSYEKPERELIPDNINLRILETLEDGYMEIDEIAEETGISSREISAAMAKMFATHDVVKIEVHTEPNKRHADVVLWASTMEAIVG